MRLDLGSPAVCSDAAFGELADVVIDPRARRATHVVVQEHDRPDSGRLVPIDRVRIVEGRQPEVRLDYTVAELTALKLVHRTAYVRLGERPDEDPGTTLGIKEVFETPAYGSLGVNALGAGMEPLQPDPHVTMSYDLIPEGTVEIRRSSDVTCSDGHTLGRLVGVAIDEQAQIEHLVVERGHLWGKRELTVPVAAIDRIGSDEVVLSLPHDQLAG